MTTDFESRVVLDNTARVLRAEVLPTITDDQARRSLVQIIAVIEAHLAQSVGGDAADRADGGLLMAFGGRLVERKDEPR